MNGLTEQVKVLDSNLNELQKFEYALNILKDSHLEQKGIINKLNDKEKKEFDQIKKRN